MSTLPDTPEETPEELHQRSDAVRARLLSRIDALKDRSSYFADVAATVQREAKRHAPLLIGAGALAVVALGMFALRSRARRRRREQRDAILYAATRLLGPGYDVRLAQRPSPVAKGFKQVGKSLFALVARELGQRALEELKLAAAPPREDRSADGA